MLPGIPKLLTYKGYNATTSGLSTPQLRASKAKLLKLVQIQSQF
jgi:hypothetical protein